MSHFLLNWNFKDVVDFLQQHFFISKPHFGGSHYFFVGFVDGNDKIVEVQFHANNRIAPRSLQHDIIPKSGVPESYWKKWSEAGNKKAKRMVQYLGAQKK